MNGIPKVLTLKEMLEQYIDFQVDVITRRTKFDLNKAKEREHILKGLVIALDNIDEVIEIMKTSKNIPEAKQRLNQRFGLTDIQADHIANMTLGRLTGMERQKIIDELAEIEVKIADLEDILANHQRILDIIIEEVEAIQDKFGDERRTQIENVSGEVDIEDLIPVEESVVTYTNAGYIKRMPVSEYKAQKRGGRGVTGMKQREDDYIDELQTCSSHDNILFISNKGIMYKLKRYELPEGSKASRGTNIDEGKYIVMVTKNGKIKRTPLTSYRNVRKNGLIAIGLDEGDEIAGVRMTFGDNEVIVATHNGYAIRIRETDIREMSRVAHGVKAIKLRGSDYVVSMARVREGASVLTVAENGLGRRVPLESYKVQNRGGYGLMNYKSGGVCGIKVVDDEDDIIMISTDGIVIRIRACDISMMSRYSRGVRLMRVGEDGRVVSFTRTEHDDDVETAEVEKATAEEIAEAQAEENAEVIEENTESVENEDSENTEE